MAGGPLPQHVAFIMDGNGRWAKDRGLPRTEGHRVGVETVREILTCCRDWGIKYASLYAFSTENWKRPDTEVGVLFTLLAEYVERELDQFIRDETRLHVLGDIEPLPERPRKALENAMARTIDLDTRVVQVAVNYGGRNEILRAIRRLSASDPSILADLDDDTFSRALDTGDAPDPDLMIRTSGEQRISNFMLWQLAYSELMFVPQKWPDFKADEFRSALEQYAHRTRRFGATDDQLELK